MIQCRPNKLLLGLIQQLIETPDDPALEILLNQWSHEDINEAVNYLRANS